MSTSRDNGAPDPVRPVTYVAGSTPGGLYGQSIDNPAGRHSQFIDPVNPSGLDAKNYIPGARAARAGVEAMRIRAIVVVFATSFVAANILLLRSLAEHSDMWPQSNPVAAAALYGFSVIADTLVFGVLGSILVLAGWAVVLFAKRLWGGARS